MADQQAPSTVSSASGEVSAPGAPDAATPQGAPEMVLTDACARVTEALAVRSSLPKDPPALDVRRLSVKFKVSGGYVTAVSAVSLSLERGEILAIVGESGSGKSALLQAIVGLCRGAPGIVGGEVVVRLTTGEEVRPLGDVERGVKKSLREDGLAIDVRRSWAAQMDRDYQRVRGGAIGLVLQNGRAALDPFVRSGHQIEAALKRKSRKARPETRRAAVLSLLHRLGFAEPERVFAAYPHELSGGMAQRAMLAAVLARDPEFLLLDEVTSGLDVSIQAEILQLLLEEHANRRFSAILVTHELALARRMAKRVLIMKGGRVLEVAQVEDLWDTSKSLHPYTRMLVESAQLARPAAPRPSSTASAPPGPLASVDVIGKRFGGKKGLLPRLLSPAIPVDALKDVTLAVKRGECLALVGESGSGKTTLARILVGLTRPDSGQVTFEGRPLDQLTRAELRGLRRRLQILFQNPYTSLNPEMTAAAAVSEVLEILRQQTPEEARTEAVRLLATVGLEHRADTRLRVMSGGERRRVGLLRTIESDADFIVLDEPTTGLDAIYRHDVLARIEAARARRPERTFLIISHDMGFVARVADRVVVLYRGRMVEESPIERFADLDVAHHPYTARLFAASALLEDGVVANAGPPQMLKVSFDERGHHGCVFRRRCPTYLQRTADLNACEQAEPVLVEIGRGARIACHAISGK